MKLVILNLVLLSAALILAEHERDEGKRERDGGAKSKYRDEDFTKRKNMKESDKKDATPKNPQVGHWNMTNSDGRDDTLCIKLDAGIRLDVTYETRNGSTGTTTIVSDDITAVDRQSSKCKNSSSDRDEILALDFGSDRTMEFHFSRDPNITGDRNENVWQLHKIKFDFRYDEDFPDAKNPGKREILTNHEPLKTVASSRGQSYGCTKMDALKVDDPFTVTLNNFRVQPFLTSDDFGQAIWCANEQTSDLIPIIIGAALAALVIIVLIAYLVGRARARTTTYDNI